MRISSLAVVSPSNVPLYISTYDLADDESLRVQALIHSALDILEERVALGCRQGPNAQPDAFLGFLSLAEGLRVYGLVSNTKVRFLVAIQDAPARDEDVRAVLMRVHGAYTDAVSNPFYDTSTPLTSQRFAGAMNKVAAMPMQSGTPTAV